MLRVHDLEVQAIDNEGFKTVEPLISFECDGHKPEITLGEIPETATAMVQIDFTINARTCQQAARDIRGCAG